jgi:hypothetical protein
MAALRYMEIVTITRYRCYGILIWRYSSVALLRYIKSVTITRYLCCIAVQHTLILQQHSKHTQSATGYDKTQHCYLFHANMNI